MIIWIASYPKSGNTWVRSLLSAYLYTEDGNFDFNLLKKIKQFPNKQQLEFFLNDFSDIKKVSDYWIVAQDRINLIKDKVTFMKTHSALCTLENNSFTNKNNTKAAIYIVRDPRNLITSISHHFSKNIEDSYKFISQKNQILSGSEWGSDDFGIATIIGSWAEHYKSWLNMKFAPILIIRYEDLLNDTKSTFVKIINFLSKLMKIEMNEKKVINTINSCSFNKLVEKEKKEGFFESVKSKKTNKKLKFFYLGKENNWKNLLDSDIEKKTREIFINEMKELNYI